MFCWSIQRCEWVLNSPTITVFLLMSPFIFVSICLTYCGAPMFGAAAASVVSNSVGSHRWQPTRLLHTWDSPGKNTGVGCHFLLQCMKVKSESVITHSCPTLCDPMDCRLPGSSVHGIFQARVLELVAIAFSDVGCEYIYNTYIFFLDWSFDHYVLSFYVSLQPLF